MSRRHHFLPVFYLANFGISAAPAVFAGQAARDWLRTQPDCLKLLEGYLSDRQSGLANECHGVTAMVERLTASGPRPDC